MGTQEHTAIRVVRRYVWSEPTQAPAGSALERVRRGQVLVAVTGVALWLGGLIPGMVGESRAVLGCLLLVVLAAGLALARVRHAAVVLTGTLTATAVAVLAITRALEVGAPLAAGWFDAAAVSVLAVATLRRALMGVVGVGLVALASWAVLVVTTPVAGGWRTAVAWPVASVAIGVAAVGLAAIVRAGARRLDDAVSSGRRAFSEEELQQAERSRFEETARLLHDTVVNTLTALGRGVSPEDRAAVRLRCVQDLDLLDSSLPEEPEDPPVGLAESVRRRAVALGLSLTLAGSPDSLAQITGARARAVSGAISESLLNCAKHSGVREVEVRVTDAPGGVVVEVIDEGRGWDGEPTEGHGVQESIVDRCRAADIAVEIDSRMARGTNVTMRVDTGDDEVSEELFRTESRIMTGLVALALLADMGIRTLLSTGLVPPPGSWIPFLLLTIAMVWPWSRWSASRGFGFVAPAALTVVGLPVVLLLPAPQAGAVSWMWWGSVAAIAIFLALVSMNASAWWVWSAYLLQMVGRYIADGGTDLLFPDAIVVGLGAAVTLWIRRRVLQLMTETNLVAHRRDATRALLLREESEQRESIHRLRRASAAARPPLERIADGTRDGHEEDVRRQAAELAPYLRNVARLGPGLGEVGAGLLALLDAARLTHGYVNMTIDPRVQAPLHSEVVGAYLRAQAQCLPPGSRCSVTLLGTPEGALLNVLVPAGAAPPPNSEGATGVAFVRTVVDDSDWTEISWDDGVESAGRAVSDPSDMVR